MRKPETLWSKVGITTAVLASVGAVALLVTSDDEPKFSEHFVDCATDPDGTVSKVIHPGEQGQANLGEAFRRRDGTVVWRSIFEIHYEPHKFTIVGDGFSPPGGEVQYDEIPNGDHYHEPFLYADDSPGYVDASVSDFNASDPLNPNNAVTVMFHCGPQPPRELPPDSGANPTSAITPRL